MEIGISISDVIDNLHILKLKERAMALNNLWE